MLRFGRSSEILHLKETNLEDEGLLESYLRDFISNNPIVLAEIEEAGLVLLPPEQTASDLARDRIDLLGIDTDGAAVIIELKRGRHKLHMLQAVSYAAMIADRSAEWFKRQLTQVQLDDLKDAIAGDLDQALNQTQRIVLIAEQFEPQVIIAARWLRKFGLAVRCIEFRMAKEDLSFEPFYMQFNQIFPSPYTEHLLPQSAVTMPKEFEQLLLDIRNFTSRQTRQRAASSWVGSSSIETDPREKWETFLHSLKNPFLEDFAKKWEESGEKILPDSEHRLVFPRNGERWRIQPRRDYGFVMQHGRFEIGTESDQKFWSRQLDKRADIRVVREGKRLHFKLWTKQDFDAFWLAITRTLKDVPFTARW